MPEQNTKKQRYFPHTMLACSVLFCYNNYPWWNCVLQSSVFFRFSSLALAKSYHCPGSVKYPSMIPLMLATPDYNKTQLNAIKFIINAVLVVIKTLCTEIRIKWSFNQAIRLSFHFATNQRLCMDLWKWNVCRLSTMEKNFYIKSTNKFVWSLK